MADMHLACRIDDSVEAYLPGQARHRTSPFDWRTTYLTSNRRATSSAFSRLLNAEMRK
jgi:hypothetical protein